MWGMSTPAACLLLSRFVPATARLLAEFLRLREGLPPAEAREFAPAKQDLAKAPMMAWVCACMPARRAECPEQREAAERCPVL